MRTGRKKLYYQHRLEKHCNAPVQVVIMDTSKKGRLSQVLMKMPLIGDKHKKEQGDSTDNNLFLQMLGTPSCSVLDL